MQTHFWCYTHMLYIHTPESMGVSHSHSVAHTHMYKSIQMPSQMYMCTQLITHTHGKGHLNTRRATQLRESACSCSHAHAQLTYSHTPAIPMHNSHSHTQSPIHACMHTRIHRHTHTSKHVVLPLQYPCWKNPHKLTGIHY